MGEPANAAIALPVQSPSDPSPLDLWAAEVLSRSRKRLLNGMLETLLVVNGLFQIG